MPRRSGLLAGDRHTAADIAAAFAGERFAVYDKLAKMVAGRAARRSIAATASARTRPSSSPPVRAAGSARAIAPARSRWRPRRCTRIPAIAEVRKTFAQIERARVAEVAKQPARAPPRARAGSRTSTTELGSAQPVRRRDRAREARRWPLGPPLARHARRHARGRGAARVRAPRRGRRRRARLTDGSRRPHHARSIAAPPAAERHRRRRRRGS